MSVYALADLHGRLDLLIEGLQYLGPEDEIYFLGDAADRGPHGWECIQYILSDKRFTYIKGNHEDLLCKAFGDNIKPEKFNEDSFMWNSKMNLWFWKGGEVTFNAIIDDTTISAEEKIEIINELKRLPFCKIYNNEQGQRVLLSHAGCDNFNVADRWGEDEFLWDRNHLMFYDTWYGKDDEIIVHGHTPINYMVKEQQSYAKNFNKYPPDWNGQGAYWYSENHKCNIDTGAVWSNNTVLLNLDTWEETVITIA